MASDPILLIGGGGHALVVAEAAARSGRAITGFLDDHASPVLAVADLVGAGGARVRVSHLGGLRSIGEHVRAGNTGVSLFLAMGDLALRADVLAGLGGGADPGNRVAAPIEHPASEVSPTATIAAGVYVGPRAIVHTLARVEAHAILNSGCIVEHECQIGVNTHIAPGAVLGGRVRVGAHTLVGLGSRVLPNLRIGNRCIIGAGAVVTSDVPDGMTLVGVPAKSRG